MMGKNKHKLSLSFSEINIELEVTIEFETFICDKFFKETKQYVIKDTNVVISY